VHGSIVTHMTDRRSVPSVLVGALLWLLGGCFSLPMPFQPDQSPSPAPGALVRPPPARIVVPPPSAAGLTDQAARRFAASLAGALQELEVPATAAGIANPQYSLLVNAESEAGLVRLTYSLAGSDGKPIAAAGGPRPVPAQAWVDARAETLSATAKEAAPAIARMLATVEARRRETTTGALAERLPSAAISPITGAPGDGARSLDRAIRAALGREGVIVSDQGGGGEFTVSGRVSTTPVGRGQERIEVVWVVSRADGMELGRVAQLNEIPRGSLNGLWGDVAVIVADQAAQGVAEVIRRHRNGE
jgi:hypothetical protein